MRIVVDTEIASGLHSTSWEVEIIEPSTQCLMRTIDGIELNGNIKDEEDEFVDDVDLESDEDSPQLSD